MRDVRLLVFGLGYTGGEVARLAAEGGAEVTATSRAPGRVAAVRGVRVVAFAAAGEAVDAATHILQTAPPGEDGDPALRLFRGRGRPVWAGVLSTTGVYGDRGGGWVDEDTPPTPTGPRGTRRLEAERDWVAAFPGARVDIFRLAGIYGPGRSALDEVAGGHARRVDAPGHMFGRTHLDDIAAAVLAGMGQERPPGPRVLNITDDEPAANMDVVAEAARLLGMPPPPLVPLAEALAAMSPMGRSFWAEDRKVASGKTQERLGIRWRYPTYREGLAAILAGRGERGA